MVKIAPSILSADFSRLLDDVKQAEAGGADALHVDVMDGHFVPNISFGAVVLKCLQGKTALPFDVHLMIEDADKYIEEFVFPQTEYITVHQEACRHLHRTVQRIKALGVKAGVSVNPATPISHLESILGEVDLVLVMSVNPGFGGQRFIPSSLGKIEELCRIRRERKLDFVIEVDGGVNLDNISELAHAGVDLAVAGSAIFGSDDISGTTGKFKSAG